MPAAMSAMDAPAREGWSGVPAGQADQSSGGLDQQVIQAFFSRQGHAVAVAGDVADDQPPMIFVQGGERQSHPLCRARRQVLDQDIGLNEQGVQHRASIGPA